MNSLAILTFWIIFGLKALPYSGEAFLPPGISKGPQRMKLYRNAEILTLECEAVGKPDPVLFWYHDNSLLNENLTNINRPDPRKGTIVINPASALDEGYYQCFAENQYGRAVSDVAFLQMAVIYPYPASATNRTYRADEGTALKVECKWTKCVPKPTYTWKVTESGLNKNTRPVNITQGIQMDDEGNLYFAYLEPTHLQHRILYECIVHNPFLGTSVTGSYSQIVVNPVSPSRKKQSPLIQYQTRSPAVGLLGGNITLKCFFSGFPLPTISWSRSDGKALPLHRHYYIDQTSKKNTEILIKDLKWEDEGEYVCKALSSEGSISATIFLDIQATPIFVNIGDDTGELRSINAKNNDTVRMNCNAFGDPKVSIAWFVNGEEMSGTLPERMILENDQRTLVVTDVCKKCIGSNRTTDLMVIQCNASNVHGYVFSSGSINIKSSEPVPNGSLVELYFVIGIAVTAVFIIYIVVIWCMVFCHQCKRKPSEDKSTPEETHELQMEDVPNVDTDLYTEVGNDDDVQDDVASYITPMAADRDRSYLSLQDLPTYTSHTLKRNKSACELECKIKIKIKQR